jgi:hypothetical protein
MATKLSDWIGLETVIADQLKLEIGPTDHYTTAVFRRQFWHD